jgi:hypothetical protein
LPVLTITLYVLLCHQKEYKFLKLLLEITENQSEDKRKEAAVKIIILMHKNKWLALPKITPVNINNPKGALASIYLLKAEIEYLLENLDQRRNQKTYLHTVAPEARSELLKFLAHARKFIEETHNSPQVVPKLKIVLLHQLYLSTIVVYTRYPDENHHHELDFFPLFQIVDQTSARTIILFPLFLHQSA